MKPLTLDHISKNKFTAEDCVKYFKPDADDAYVQFILWERTCFPFSTEEMVKQLNELFMK